MYICILAESFNSILLDLREIGDTLSQVMSGGARETTSDGSLSVGLQLLQKHAVKLDNDQTMTSELRKFKPQPFDLESNTLPLCYHVEHSF